MPEAAVDSQGLRLHLNSVRQVTVRPLDAPFRKSNDKMSHIESFTELANRTTTIWKMGKLPLRGTVMEHSLSRSASYWCPCRSHKGLESEESVIRMDVDDGLTTDEVQTLNPDVQPFVPRAAPPLSSDRQAPMASSLPMPNFDGDPMDVDSSPSSTLLQSPADRLQNPCMPAVQPSTHTPCRDSTEKKNGPDVLGDSQTDVHASAQHVGPTVTRTKRQRKKPVHLANFICTIKVGSISPKKVTTSKTGSKSVAPEACFL